MHHMVALWACALEQGPVHSNIQVLAPRTYRALTAGTAEAPDAVLHMVLFTMICRWMLYVQDSHECI